MKTSTFLTALTLASTLLVAARAEEVSPGWVDFGRLAAPAGGGQFVEINLKSGLLGLAARITESDEPEIANLLRGLQAVRVNVVGLDEANRSTLRERLLDLGRELDGKGWERIVSVQEKGHQVGVYLKHRGEEAIEGVVVTVIDNDKQAVFINVVGDIRPEKIALLGEKLDIEPLKKVGSLVKKS